MKKNNYILFILLAGIFSQIFAQAPNLMSYQAVVRNSNNELVTNTLVGMKVSILQTTATGTEVYSETHNPQSNANGLVSISIGAGVTKGSFAKIDWSKGPYFIKTEIDPLGGTSYTITGTTQLLSVPYALYAANSGSSIPGPMGPIGPAGPTGATGATGLPGKDGANAVKILTGYLDANNTLGTGFTVTRLANQQYVVSWPAGTFSSLSFPMVSTFGGTVALSSWGANGNGSGSFTTVVNAGATIWFTITEIK